MKRSFVPVVAVGLLSVGLMYCGNPSECGPTNCGGCCDASGQCVTEFSKDQCGRLGASCEACTGTNVCVAGACAANGMGGGAGTTGGGAGTTGGGTGTTGGGSATTGGGTGSTGGGVGCTTIDFSQSETLFGEFTPGGPMATANHYVVVGADSATTGKFNFMTIEGWYFDTNENPTFPKTVLLPSPNGASYWNCFDCVLLEEDCDNMGANCARVYYAQNGSLAISAATMNADVGVFTATGTSLEFTQWQGLAENQDAPVPNGRCATVASVTINATWDNTPADAGVDAGTEVDAGVDAGTEVDAGNDFDAGVDAGADVDAGSDVDAGTELDAGFDDDAGVDAGTDPNP